MTIKEAVRVPPVVGVNVTLMLHAPPAATELPQVFIWAKSPGLAPKNETLLTKRAAFPVLFNTTVCGPLVVPMF